MESQRSVLQVPDVELSAMFTKRAVDSKVVICSACGGKGHTCEKCWTVIGYPPWHLKHKKQGPRKPGGKFVGPKMANNVSHTGCSSQGEEIVFSSQQLQQLLKLIPNQSLQTLKGESETDDELDIAFSGMVTCNMASCTTNTWIVDLGASDHITGSVEKLVNVKPAGGYLTITLPTCVVSQITHIGDVKMMNDLILCNVLVVPQFKHNSLSIHKLARDNECEIQFTPQACAIIHSATKLRKAVGKMCNGLYYLVDQPQSSVAENVVSTSVFHKSVCNNAAVDYSVWHLRLGHAAASKMKHIPHLKHLDATTEKVCLTCPMAKFAKLSYALSDSHSKTIFALLHIDTWGPYKVPTRGKFKYFLTVVDDNSRATWLYLMEYKSEFIHCFQAFYNYVNTHFGVKIECIRTDNAPEFSDPSCVAFYSAKGVLHQKSCVNRPQQNTRVEIKHRNVL